MAPDPIRLGDFVLHEPIATGGIGQVWRGEHRRGTPVALKVLGAEALTRPVWVDSLNAEIRAVAGLSHDHIVWIHDAGVVSEEEAAASNGQLAEGLPWYAMELADGGTLQDLPPLQDWDSLLALLDALLDALAHAHAHGIVHRDLKPANVLFAGEVPKLSDFGMVYRTEPGDASVAIGGGTPAYMAPEQFEGLASDLGPWTDLYALGCLAYSLASGRRPFKGNNWVRLYSAHLTEQPPALDPMFEVPKGFAEWVDNLMAKDRLQRFQRAADARFALHRLDEPTTRVAEDESYATEETMLDELEFPPMPRFVRPPVGDFRDRRPPKRPNLGVGLGLYGLRQMPFLGRRDLRDRLWKTLAEVDRTGVSRAVVLRGPAGVGKSRMAEWLCTRAHELGVAEIFRTTHGPLPGNFDGVAGLLGRSLRVFDVTAEDLLPVIRNELSPRGLREPGFHAAIAEMIAPTDRRMAESQRYDLVMRVIEAMSGTRPAVIWFDDVQWGPSVIDLCDHLLTARGAPPALMVLTVREESLVDEPDALAALEDLLDHAHATEIEVGPMSREASVALIERGLGLQAQLADRLYRRIAGNPMFAVELVGDWVERGLLVPGDRGFRLARPEAFRTPTSVGAVWDGRLKALYRSSPELELPLIVAAALGIEVDHGEWVRACEAAGVEPPADLWGRLQDLRLARRDPMGNRFAFVHGMLRETILERAQRESRLQGVHSAIAGSLEDLGRRGLHLLEAGQLVEAAQMLLEAARGASGMDLRGALRMLQLRDEALEERDADDPARVEGWLLASEVCRLSAHPKTGKRWARTALRWASARRHRELTVRALQESAACSRMMGDLLEARQQVDAGLRLSEGLPASVRASTLFECGATLFDSGDLKGAERALVRAMELSGADIGRVRAATLLASILARTDRAREGRLLLMEVFPIAQAGSQVRFAYLHNALGEVARVAGDLDLAEEHYTEALELLEGTDINDPAIHANLALVYFHRGEIDRSRQMMRQVMRDADALSAKMLLLLAHAGLAACAAEQRDWHAMRVHLLALREDSGVLVDEDIASCLRYAGTTAMALEERHLARLALEQAAMQYRTLGIDEEADALVRLARS